MTKEQGGPRGFQMDEEAGGESGAGTGTAGAPPITFGTFVLSLSTSAVMHLGIPLDPEAGEPPPVNLPLAQQTIDILAMLLEKTKGNLLQDEQSLLEGVLHDLRMRYVETRDRESSRS